MGEILILIFFSIFSVFVIQGIYFYIKTYKPITFENIFKPKNKD